MKKIEQLKQRMEWVGEKTKPIQSSFVGQHWGWLVVGLIVVFGFGFAFLQQSHSFTQEELELNDKIGTLKMQIQHLKQQSDVDVKEQKMSFKKAQTVANDVAILQTDMMALDEKIDNADQKDIEALQKERENLKEQLKTKIEDSRFDYGAGFGSYATHWKASIVNIVLEDMDVQQNVSWIGTNDKGQVVTIVTAVYRDGVYKRVNIEHTTNAYKDAPYTDSGEIAVPDTYDGLNDFSRLQLEMDQRAEDLGIGFTEEDAKEYAQFQEKNYEALQKARQELMEKQEEQANE